MRSWSRVWDGFDETVRVSYAADWRRVREHVEDADKQSREKEATDSARRVRRGLQIAGLSLLVGIASAVGGLVSHPSPAVPQKIVVQFPGGQTVTITPTVGPTAQGQP